MKGITSHLSLSFQSTCARSSVILSIVPVLLTVACQMPTLPIGPTPTPPSRSLQVGSFIISSAEVPIRASASCPNESGEIAFWDESSKGIFLSSRGTINKVASENDIKPAGWEEVQVHPFSLSLNASGKIAFVAHSWKERLQSGRTYAPGTLPPSSDTVFLAFGGALRKVATSGDPTPMASKFFGFLPQVSLNSKDQVLFAAFTFIGEPGPRARDQSGLFLASKDKVVKVVAVGDPSPVGGTFSQLLGGIGGGMAIPFSFSLNNHGHVAFVGFVKGGTASVAVFVASDGVFRKVVAVGEPLPTMDNFVSLAFPALNDVGDVSFFASRAGYAQGGIFLYSRGTRTKIAVTGDSTPIGGQFAELDSHPALNNKGQVAFGAKTTEGRKGIFVASGGVIQKVVMAGDPTPLGGFHTFPSIMGPAYDFPPWGYCIYDSGRVDFRADQGFFLASPIK